MHHAESFYLMGDLEKDGTGFIRIRKWLEEYPGVSYQIRETGDFFKVVLRFNKDEAAHALDKYRTSTGQGKTPKPLPRSTFVKGYEGVDRCKAQGDLYEQLSSAHDKRGVDKDDHPGKTQKLKTKVPYD